MHKDWCGWPCAGCARPCVIDENTPCSLDCENLSLDGSRDVEKCRESGCDAIPEDEGGSCVRLGLQK